MRHVSVARCFGLGSNDSRIRTESHPFLEDINGVE
jgi:hypothetical protein